MPYDIREHFGEYCVYKEGDSEPMKCYADRAEADAYMKALWAAESDDDAKANDDPLARLTEPQRESLFKRISKALSDAVNGKPARPAASGFKVYNVNGSARWLAWWTNNFEDRDKEIFSAKAIDDYIARVDAGVIDMPELWFWHIPGTRHGQADWMARIDHMAVAAGTFDDSPRGKAAQRHYAKQRKPYGVSHGFLFPASALKDGVYSSFNTFEISPLPIQEAANPYTAFSIEKVKEMALTTEKVRALKALFGEEEAERIIADTLEASKAVDSLGAKFKDFVKMTEADYQTDADEDDDEDKEVDPEVAADEEAEDEMREGESRRTSKAVTAIARMYPELVADVGEVTRVTDALVDRIKSLEAELASRKERQSALEQRIADIESIVNARPRSAVRGESKPLADNSPLKTAAEKATAAEKWSAIPGLFSK